MPHTELTILTVAGPDDEPFVRRNIELIRQTNPYVSYTLYVIDNTLQHELATLQGYLGTVILPGVPQDPAIPKSVRGSYHHAAALNHFLRTHTVHSPYLLIIDPDFYAIRPNWIRELTHIMKKRELSFFGAPWNPRWYNKYRYFPCVHFMMVDCGLDLKSLDFMPDMLDCARQKELRKAREAQQKIADATSKFRQLKRLRGELFYQMKRAENLVGKILFRKLKGGSLIYWLWQGRAEVEKSNDTGYLLHRRYAKDKRHASALLQPVANSAHFKVPVLSRFNRLIEKALPDRWRYLPKRKGYFTVTSFQRYGLPVPKELQWEEFMWRAAPFALHLRRQNKKRDYDPRTDLQALSDVLAIAIGPETSARERSAG